MKRTLAMAILLATLQCLSHAQWTDVNTGLSDWSVGALYADGDTLYAGTATSIFKSTNLGGNWASSGSGLPATPNFYAMVRSGNALIAGGDAPGLWRSTNNGASWTQVASGVDPDEAVFSLFADGNTVYAAIGFTSAVGISTNSGVTWTKFTTGLATTQTMTGIAKIGTTLFACHQTLGVYSSTNSGTNWTLTNPIGAQDKNAVISMGGNLCVGVNNGIFRSTDNGTIWTRVLTSGVITGLSAHGANLYAVGQSQYVSTNAGATWTLIDDTGLPGTVFNTMQFAGTYAYVNYFGVGVYRRPISQITDVRDEQQGAPQAFRLEQNYPNPFNPSTTFSFSVPHSSFIVLAVYDLFGQEVATLVNREMQPGTYAVKWDATGLASGVYFSTLLTRPHGGDRTGGYVQTRKVSLLR